MFTIEQINGLHDRLGTMETFSQYVRALKSVGVEAYDCYLVDGHSEYFGSDGYTVKSPPIHEKLTVADTSNREEFLNHLNLHNEHKTSYLEMSKGLTESGIEKWTVDTNKQTMTFYDKAGNEMPVEAIEERRIESGGPRRCRYVRGCDPFEHPTPLIAAETAAGTVTPSAAPF